MPLVGHLGIPSPENQLLILTGGRTPVIFRLLFSLFPGLLFFLYWG